MNILRGRENFYNIMVGIGILLTFILTVYVTKQNKEQYYFNHYINAETNFLKMEAAYSKQAGILATIKSFYEIDSQVTYDEFSALIHEILKNIDKSDQYNLRPKEIGWVSIEPGSNKNVLSGQKPSEFIVLDANDNTYFKSLGLLEPQNFPEKFSNYNNGLQILAQKVSGKIADDDVNEDTLFSEAGYMYIVIDIQNLLQSFKNSLGNSGYAFIGDIPSNIKNQRSLLQSIFVREIDFSGNKMPLTVLQDDDWNIYDLQRNLVSILIFVIGILLSFGLTKYLCHLLQQNDKFKNASIQAEEKADLNQKLLIKMLDALPVAVFGKDVQNGYVFSFFNKEAENLFGMPKSYMLRKSDYDLWPESEATWFRKTDEKVIEGGVVVDVPYEQVTPAKGEPRLIHTRKVPIFDKKGEPVILLGVAIDVTDRVANEKELERHRYHLENIVKERTGQLEDALQKAEDYSRMKSDFLATMSHEIRTPMNGILGMAELIQNASPPPQIARYAKTIINSGEALQQVIDDILDFSKIEAGKLGIHPMPVDMVEIVDDVARLYDLQARDKALEVVVCYKPGTEQFFYADPVRMQQILGNMLSNAIKFTEKGYIVFTVQEEEGAEKGSDIVDLKFSISDTGIGLSEEEQAKIFEKFTQGDNSTTRKYGGTGLGLSICRSLVELMGGEIGVESQKGAGSTFWFSIPIARNTKESCAAPKPPILKNLRVLVVDDLQVVCELMQEQLSAAGMICETARNGKLALEKMHQASMNGKPYDIAIIDYLMPGMNGEMLASALNDHEDLRDTCLIMLTSAFNQLDDDYFAKKGFSAYLAKPISNQSLIESISIVWERYSAGEKDTLIPIDLRLGLQEGMDDVESMILPDINVLVAEDNLVNQVFIQEILQEMNVRFTLVCDGQEAVNAVQKQQYDLIIMDCLMPVMDGFEASKEIMALKKQGVIKEDLPILALTANAMVGDKEKCLRAGMDDYLAKPVRQKDLKEKVYTLVTGRSNANHSDSASNIRKVDFSAIDDHQILDEEAVGGAKKILKDKYDEIVEVFLKTSLEQIEEIAVAISKENSEMIIRPAHTLKSTAKRMGAFKLSKYAEEVERKGKGLQGHDENRVKQDLEEIQEYVEEMKAALEDTKAAFIKIAA